jgi:hypothetical protein
MDLNDLDAKVATEAGADTQRAALGQLHLSGLRSAIAGLAALGHRVVVEVEGLGAAQPPVVKFPQMLHKPDGSELVVNTSEELATALADGWSETPGDGEQPAAQADTPLQAQPAPPPVFTADLSKLPEDPSKLAASCGQGQVDESGQTGDGDPPLHQATTKEST